jgi:hypothetical protein
MQAGRDPVEDELIGQRRIVQMALRGGRLGALEDLQRDVLAAALELIDQFGHPARLQPAAFAGCNQQRARDLSHHAAGSHAMKDVGTAHRRPPRQERPFMRIPDAAVADRRRKPLIEGDASRDKGRRPAIGEDRDTAVIHIAAAGQIIHEATDRRFEVVGFERGIRLIAQNVYREK